MKNMRIFDKRTNVLVYGIQVVVSILFIGVLIMLGSIPMLYIGIASAFLALLLLVEYFLIFTKKKNSKRSVLTKIISLLLSIVMVVASFYATRPFVLLMLFW